MVLLQLVMRGVMRAVFKVLAEVRIKVYVDDKKVHVQGTTAGATATARKSPRIIQDATGHERSESVVKEGRIEGKSRVPCTSRWVMKDMKIFCVKEGAVQNTLETMPES